MTGPGMLQGFAPGGTLVWKLKVNTTLLAEPGK
jgi:hypothetical protein